ncbi:hypothetical protein E2C01_081102 [Portunus trituberculatus]|uniref:Uncharacterized protein n=1 Tax=Portunus trituberculatus TaxID=210409 RepID=A0A5B7IVQ9_PORTR|nr:hypothetical protein [Portunus trituberculatus]
MDSVYTIPSCVLLPSFSSNSPKHTYHLARNLLFLHFSFPANLTSIMIFHPPILLRQTTTITTTTTTTSSTLTMKEHRVTLQE